MNMGVGIGQLPIGIRQGQAWLALTAAAMLLAACAVRPPTPTGIVVQAVASATRPAISLPAYGTDVALSATAPSDLATQTPTDSDVRTKTPPPETPSATPTGTGTRRPSGGPAATATLPVSVGPAPDTSAYGVSATFGLETPKSAYRPGEHVWFDFTLTNLKALPLDYGEVGVILPNGSFHSSLSGSSLSANERLSWRDWVSFSSSGDQSLILAMCISTVDECRTGGTWVNLSAPVVVSIN
jgi:hypothetical protein